MSPTPEEIRAACDQLSREMQSGPFRAALEAVVRATDAPPASSSGCTNPDTDGGISPGGHHYGYCNGCGWQSKPNASADVVHAYMEAHRLEANERWRASRVSSIAARGVAHYCEGCEAHESDSVALPLVPTESGELEWCDDCIEAMPADVLRRYWPSA